MKIINTNQHEAWISQVVTEEGEGDGMVMVRQFEVLNVTGRNADLALSVPGFRRVDELTDEDREAIDAYCSDYELAYGHLPGEKLGDSAEVTDDPDATADPAAEFESMNVKELKAATAELTVDGSGKDGKVVKADMVAALVANANPSIETDADADEGGGTITSGQAPSKAA